MSSSLFYSKLLYEEKEFLLNIDNTSIISMKVIKKPCYQFIINLILKK